MNVDLFWANCKYLALYKDRVIQLYLCGTLVLDPVSSFWFCGFFFLSVCLSLFYFMLS